MALPFEAIFLGLECPQQALGGIPPRMGIGIVVEDIIKLLNCMRTHSLGGRSGTSSLDSELVACVRGDLFCEPGDDFLPQQWLPLSGFVDSL